MKFTEQYSQIMSEASFSWKRPGKMGSFSVRFRFTGEQAGERFFDNEYAVYDEKPGYFEVGSRMQGNHDIDRSNNAQTDNLDKYLKPGTKVTITPSWISPKGGNTLSAVDITIKSVKKIEDYALAITYN